jgi:hypothetical protein
LLENRTLRNKLQGTQGNGVGHERVVSMGMIPKNFPFAQLSIGNGAEFGDESIKKLEAAL